MTNILKPAMSEPEATDSQVAKTLRNYYQSSQAYKSHLREKEASYFRNYVALLAEAVGAGSLVLDVGCGTGQSTEELRKAGLRAVGCDLSPLFLTGSESRGFVAANAAQLPFDDGLFDAVGAHEFIEHVSDVSQVLKELWRVTKPGGSLILSSPNLFSPLVVIRDLPGMLLHRRYRPPLYSTFLQALRYFFSSCILSSIKWFSNNPGCIYRSPDLEQADNGGDFDAVYCSHPRDLVILLRRFGAQVEYARPPKRASVRDSAVMMLRRLLGPFWMNFFLVAHKQTPIPR